MESSQILIAGIGGLGCVWAARAHQRGAGASLLMLDADDRFPDVDGAHIIRLGHTLDALGCAALPPLASAESYHYQSPPGDDGSIGSAS